MNNDKQLFLNLREKPARVNADEAAWMLGFSSHEIPVLMRARLLRPLGNPPHNGVKWFATAELIRLRADPQWLARASDAVVQYWRGKNARKTAASEPALHR